MASQYKVLVTGQLTAKSANNVLKVIPEGTFQLVRASDTNVPAVIYTNDSGTIANSSGNVSTTTTGAYAVYLDPDFAPYREKYNGTLYGYVNVAPDRREDDTAIAAFATAKGFTDATSSEPVASQEWVEEYVAEQNFAVGLTEEDVEEIVDDAITALLATGSLVYYTGTSGPPGSGTWTQGRLAVDNTGRIWTCKTAGTPGTWYTEPRINRLDSDDADPTNPQANDFKVQSV